MTAFSPQSGPIAGGTLVTVFGTGFGSIAIVVFEEIAADGSTTGVQRECVWSPAELPGTSCNDSAVVYVNENDVVGGNDGIGVALVVAAYCQCVAAVLITLDSFRLVFPTQLSVASVVWRRCFLPRHCRCRRLTVAVLSGPVGV